MSHQLVTTPSESWMRVSVVASVESRQWQSPITLRWVPTWMEIMVSKYVCTVYPKIPFIQKKKPKWFKHILFKIDIIKWKRFPHYWSFLKGIHWSLVDPPYKEPVTRAIGVSFGVGLSKVLNKQSNGCWLGTPWCSLGKWHIPRIMERSTHYFNSQTRKGLF